MYGLEGIVPPRKNQQMSQPSGMQMAMAGTSTCKAASQVIPRKENVESLDLQMPLSTFFVTMAKLPVQRGPVVAAALNRRAILDLAEFHALTLELSVDRLLVKVQGSAPDQEYDHETGQGSVQFQELRKAYIVLGSSVAGPELHTATPGRLQARSRTPGHASQTPAGTDPGPYDLSDEGHRNHYEVRLLDYMKPRTHGPLLKYIADARTKADEVGCKSAEGWTLEAKQGIIDQAAVFWKIPMSEIRPPTNDLCIIEVEFKAAKLYKNHPVPGTVIKKEPKSKASAEKEPSLPAANPIEVNAGAGVLGKRASIATEKLVELTSGQKAAATRKRNKQAKEDKTAADNLQKQQEAEAAADPAAVKKAADIAQAILDAGGRVR